MLQHQIIFHTKIIDQFVIYRRNRRNYAMVLHILSLTVDIYAHEYFNFGIVKIKNNAQSKKVHI